MYSEDPHSLTRLFFFTLAKSCEIATELNRGWEYSEPHSLNSCSLLLFITDDTIHSMCNVIKAFM